MHDQGAFGRVKPALRIGYCERVKFPDDDSAHMLIDDPIAWNERGAWPGCVAWEHRLFSPVQSM
jgi:hypothetical protein